MKFFIVDDDQDTLALVSHLLTEAGHEVTVRASSAGAIADITEARPDCVVTDVMMPVMDGFELTRELRRNPELAAMKILILSAKSYDFDRRRAKEMGADGYITKPIKRETFLKSVNEFVSNRILLRYWGVHGTLPAPGPAYTRYGGNTPCVSMEIGGEPQRFSGRIFISHTHWDHINTVPFFAPLYLRGNQIELFGPYQGDLPIERAISAQMESVYFPVTVREFGARLVFRDLREERLAFGPMQIDTMLLRHPGYCLGYKLACRGRTICYITDNELYLPTDPRHDARYVQRLADFVRGADVLITDTTYRDHEYPSKVDWGHSCVSQVADFAARAEVKRLHLFHHDPDQTDDDIDAKLGETRRELERLKSNVACEAPAEGGQLVL